MIRIAPGAMARAVKAPPRTPGGGPNPAVPRVDARGADPATPARLPWRRAMWAAAVVTLVRPSTWVVGLAGFLAGGGIVLAAWPILVLPTLTGIQNLLGTPVSSLVFGAPSAELVALVAWTLGIGITALVAGLLAGAWAERRGIEMVIEAAAEEGFTAAAPDLARAPGVVRLALLRFLALGPPLVVAALAWPTLYDVTYHELILPEDLVTPLPVRVIVRIPGFVAAVLVAWLLSDAAGATGVRRLVLERRSVISAWGLGWLDLVRRPHRILPTAVLGLAAVVLAGGPALLVAGLGWDRVREMLLVGRDPVVAGLAVVTWVAIWLGALVLLAAGAAFRAAAWTTESVRVRR